MNLLPESYLTLSGPAGPQSLRVKGSRFLSLAFPISNLQQADQRLAQIRHHYHDATHVCHALRLGEGVESHRRFSDDGEPSQTAGWPIFQEILGADLFNVLLLVVRYFGGTKLGTGGLVKAYGACARLALPPEAIRTVENRDVFEIRFAFELTGEVMASLARAPVEVLAQEHHARGTCLTLSIPVGAAAGWRKDLLERTRGRVVLEEVDRSEAP